MTPILHLFVYGTLKRGQESFNRALAEAVLDQYEVTTPGRLYLAMRRGIYIGYPFADFTETGTVKGDFLVLNANDPGVRAVVEMELGAGYVPVTVPCEIANSGNTIFALGFHFPYQKIGRMSRGTWVEDGDWLRAHNKIMEGLIP